MAQRISADLKEADAASAKSKIQEFKALLPFLLEIPKEERKKGQKIGQASVGFVAAAVSAAVNNPDLLARKFSIEEFQKDMALFNALSPLDDDLEIAFQKLRDTILMLGKDLMEQANEVYADVKKEAKRNNSLKPLADSLGEFYKKSKKEVTQPPTPPAA